MRRSACNAAIVALLALPAIVNPRVSHGFELFGVHLWGEEEQDPGIVIIDPKRYTVSLQISGGGDDAESIVQNSSALWRDRETPASGNAGLLSKGRGDYRRILAGLYNAGYFGAEVSILAAGQEVFDLTLGADLPENVPIIIAVNAGRRFTFGRAEIINEPPLVEDPEDAVDSPRSTGFESGEEARASAIGSATQLSIEQWRQLSRARAQETGREIVANHPANVLDVTVTIDPGPPAKYGLVRATGSEEVDLDFIEYMADLEPGKQFDPDDIEESADRLALLGTFDSIRFEEGEVIAPDGSLPITIVVKDRKKRTIGFGGTYSTLDGLGLSAYYLHRNLFGRAEKLRFDASIEQLLKAGSVDDLNYNLGVTFTKPGVLNPETDLITSVVGRQLDFDTYRETSVTGRFGLSRIYSDRLKAELYGVVSQARFKDDFGTRNFRLFGVTGRGEYDRRDDEFEPTEGYYLAAEATPFYDTEFGNGALRATVEGRTYYGFGEERRVVLAGRAKIGTFMGPPPSEAPPNQLFFAGGGGSVRGYEYQSIGVEGTDSDGETVVAGGRSLLELSGEVRTRISDRWGVVGFVDAGVVTEESEIGGGSELRVGAGVGGRLYTGFGPLRVDVAVPVDRRSSDDRFGLYIGIGQAF